MINIIIADDHQVFIDGVKLILAQRSDVIVIGEASDGHQVLQLLESHTPDIILMDLSMPGMNGIEASIKILNTYEDVKIIAFTMNGDFKSVKALFEAGIHGYILKDLGQEELFTAIDTVYGGNSHYSKEVVNAYMAGVRKRRENLNQQEFKLTKKELEILKRVAVGKTTAQISEEFSRAPETISKHRKNMVNKAKTMLGLNNMTALVAYAKDEGWLD